MASNKISLPACAPFAILFLGVWLITCSHTFGYAHTTLAINEQICGGLLLILGWSARTPRYWVLGGIGVIGVWLQFAPLLLRVSTAAG